MSDYRTTTGESMPLPKRDRRRRFWKFTILGTVALAAVVAAGMWIHVDFEVLASGHVTTRLYAEVRPATQGAISEILAWSGDTVKAGDVLARLDDSEQQASFNEAVSRANKAEAELSRREAALAQDKREREHEIAMLRLRLDHATAKFGLTSELHTKGLASGSALEDAMLQQKLAQAQLTTVLEFDETLPQREITVLRQEVRAAQDAVARADSRLQARRIGAPIPGKVLRYDFVIGELVGPDTVLYEVFGGDEQILVLRVPERYATLIASKQPYRATLRPFKKGLQRNWFTGRVEKLRDVIQAEKEKTYRVVYCSFNAKGLPVPPGTTAEARICVGRGPLWVNLFGLY